METWGQERLKKLVLGPILDLDLLFRKRGTRATPAISQQFSGLRRFCFSSADFP